MGNNDRHFYNWGVIVDIMGRRPPVFSPIFDTARALYWNTPESRPAEIASDQNRRRAHLSKYIERCYPKTGWDNLSAPNHFALVRAIAEGRPELRPVLQSLCGSHLTEGVVRLLQGEFKNLLSPLRADFILECLDRRATMFNQLNLNL